MRTLVRIRMDTATSNAAIKDGSIPKLIQEVIERIKPEASYFFPEKGRRTAMFIFDLKHQSDIPSIAEPFFADTLAEVEFFPVMNSDDLMAGLQKMAGAEQRGNGASATR